MFLIGFFTAWTLISIFVLCADNRNTGIQLFDGWGANVLTLPILIIILPINFIITFVKYQRKGE